MIPETAEEYHAARQQAAVEALARGRAALAEGDFAAAEAWLDRARRVAGGNPVVEMLLATARLRRGDAAGAAALFGAVADRHDVREAWLGLTAAEHAAGRPGAAAVALGRALGGHAAVVDDGLRQLAGAVCDAAGAAGWSAVGPDGRVIGGPADVRLSFALDGAPLRAPPKAWRLRGRVLEVSAGGRPVIGSPFDPARLGRVSGFVEDRGGVLAGWVWYPHNPDRVPALRVVAENGARLMFMAAAAHAEEGSAPLARLRRIELAGLGAGLIRVIGPDGRELTGSPLVLGMQAALGAGAARAVAGAFPAAGRPIVEGDPAGLLRYAPVPVGERGTHHPPGGASRREIAVVVPVYRGLAQTLACLASVSAHSPVGTEVIVVDDASPEPALSVALDELAARRKIRLLRNVCNLGFPGSANRGIRASGRPNGGADVVLLNADTLVPPNWLARLAAAAYAAIDIGSASPLSNDATLLSYPRQEGGNAVPDAAATAALARHAYKANGDGVVDIPTGVGFCMFIRRDCLDQVGALRTDVFAQGYGEENDFCLRARRLGWRHVAATGAFVAHIGGQSFGAARSPLLTRNLGLLNWLHPGYDALIAADASGPELAAARRRIDLERRRVARRGVASGSVLIVTHDVGGGVERQVAVRRAAIRAAGDRAIVLRPVLARPLLKGLGKCLVDDDGASPNLVFDIPAELSLLTRHLAAERPRRIELHHMLGHDHGLMALPGLLGVPYEVHVHDYAWFCPQVTLVGVERRYCGEPDIAGCQACVADIGRKIDDPIEVAALVARSATDLAGAARVVAPSADVASRIARHFPAIRAEVTPWDEVRPATRALAPARAPAAGGERVVAVLGAIGIEKGYEVLLACARDAAARRLALRFVVIGHSTDDARLLETGRVFVTGEYRPAELPGLMAQHAASLAWLPSIWPETWCFTLSEAWQAGLDVVAFDIGAPGERIARHGGGGLLPLGCPPGRINAALLGYQPRRQKGG